MAGHKATKAQIQKPPKVQKPQNAKMIQKPQKPKAMKVQGAMKSMKIQIQPPLLLNGLKGKEVQGESFKAISLMSRLDTQRGRSGPSPKDGYSKVQLNQNVEIEFDVREIETLTFTTTFGDLIGDGIRDQDFKFKGIAAEKDSGVSLMRLERCSVKAPWPESLDKVLQGNYLNFVKRFHRGRGLVIQ